MRDIDFFTSKSLHMKILISAVLVLVTIHSSGQKSLSNTTWKGIFLIPQAVDVMLDFKKDTLYITAGTSEEVGTIFFTQQKDTLMIKKISGPSPCTEQTQGKYRIEWFDNGDKFRLHGISDECEGRIEVFTINQFERVRHKQ